MIFAEQCHALKTIDARQFEVHENEIGMLCRHDVQCLAAIANRAQDLQPGTSLDDHLEHFAI